jgi:hypothetical protein
VFVKSLLFACLTVACLFVGGASAQNAEIIAKNGLWKTECRYNQIMKRRECDVTFEFNQPGSQFIAGKIFVDVFKKQITVFAADNPTAFKLAVDQGKAMAAKCGVGCTIDGAAGAALFQQMLKGKSFSFSLTTEAKTSLDRSEQLAGFAECVAAANK